jgi:dihydroxyacid dehydratase/phosphogluconate dehydratase
MANKSKTVLIDSNPGRNAQTYGIARELGTDMDLIHRPSVGVIGNKGDSQCYLGVQRKVEAIHEHLRSRLGKDDGKIQMRLVQPEYTVATSDGMRNGTREMRYSLIGREVTHDTVCEHLSASGLEGTIAVVACDKPPVGTLAGILEHNRPAIIVSDGPILSVAFRTRQIQTTRHGNVSPAKPAPDTAAAAGCLLTTRCKLSLRLSAWSPCTWCRRRPMTNGEWKCFHRN